MNKDRLLHDAKLVAINLIETYVKPENYLTDYLEELHLRIGTWLKRNV